MLQNLRPLLLRLGRDKNLPRKCTQLETWKAAQTMRVLDFTCPKWPWAKIRPNFCACPWHSPTSAGGRLDTRRAPNDIFVLQSLWTRGCLRLGGVWAAAFRWQKLNWCVHDTTQKGTTALRRSMHTLSFNIFPIPSVCFYNPMTWENPNISQPSASSGGPTSEMSILFHRG